jgi:hypothetical protein
VQIIGSGPIAANCDRQEAKVMKASEAIGRIHPSLMNSQTRETAGDLADMLESIGFKQTSAHRVGDALVITGYVLDYALNFTVHEKLITFDWED